MLSSATTSPRWPRTHVRLGSRLGRSDGRSRRQGVLPPLHRLPVAKDRPLRHVVHTPTGRTAPRSPSRVSAIGMSPERMRVAGRGSVDCEVRTSCLPAARDLEVVARPELSATRAVLPGIAGVTEPRYWKGRPTSHPKNAGRRGMPNWTATNAPAKTRTLAQPWIPPRSRPDRNRARRCLDESGCWRRPVAHPDTPRGESLEL